MRLFESSFCSFNYCVIVTAERVFVTYEQDSSFWNFLTVASHFVTLSVPNPKIVANVFLNEVPEVR